MSHTRIFLTLSLLLSVNASSRAVAPGMLDDFQDGTTQGWTTPGVNPNPPVLVPSGGRQGVGDGFLRIEASGEGGAGSRLIAFNESQWTGDYLNSSINAILVDVRNPNDEPLELRLAFENFDEGSATSSTVGIPLAANSDWQTVRFPIGPNDLISLDPIGYATTMSNVSRLRILHNTTPSIRGLTFAGTLHVDNVRSVPEPSTLSMLIIPMVVVASRRRIVRRPE